MNKLILLIDDDRLPMQYYTKAISEQGFEVCQCADPDSALDTLAKMASEIVLIILDVMMQGGKAYAGKDTHEGLRTGVFLLQTIKEKWPHIPVIVLTNVRNPTTLSECKDHLAALDCLFQKMECPPFELIDTIKAILTTHKEPQYSRDSEETS